jgi:hypothetical protein
VPRQDLEVAIAVQDGHVDPERDGGDLAVPEIADGLARASAYSL